MLSKAFATVGWHGPSTEGHGDKATARSRFHTQARIRGIALLLCVFSLVVSAPVLIVLATPPGQDGSGKTTEGSTTGNSVVGKNLFTGSTRFRAGGPPCLACHSIAGIGALGGGAMGPNLTGAYDRLGAAMVIWPGGVPPMRAIFMDKPLTPDEKTHLLAFFESAAVTQRPTRAVLQLSVLAAAGTVLMLGLTHLVWLRRSRSVRKTMVRHQPLH